jgi:uncharacterized protein YqhQ
MANTQEKFKTMIGGQALIEGIMMRGPKLDAIVVRNSEGITVETKPRKVRKRGSFATWPLIRGAVNFFDSQITGVKAIMRSADLSPEETQEDASKFDKWLEKKLGDKKFQSFLVGTAVALGLGMSILLFFLIPMLVGSVISIWVHSNLAINLIEGLVRILIFIIYMMLISRMSEMRRVFAYHGAEHKTIRCYEAGLPLTVENIRKQTRLHPRCGTSFLLIVLILSILVFSIASSALLAVVPNLESLLGSFLYRLTMIAFKLLLLPLVVSISYEINRLVGRYDNKFTRIITAPGVWFQNFTTAEPDDQMIEVGIASLEAVLPD